MISLFDLSATLAHGLGRSGCVDSIDCSLCTVFRCERGRTDPL